MKTEGILKKMPRGESATSQQQLERILASPGFAQNERLSRFLRFLVERQLEGRESELKESVIGIEVFGRRPDYNPKRDAIVRTEAGRLRSRLADYYANGGKLDPLVIELPKGGYVPVIRPAEPIANPPTASTRRFRTPVLTMTVLAAVVAIAGLAWLWASKKSATAVTIGKPAETSRNGFANSLQLRRYETSPAFEAYLHARSAYHPGQEIPDTNLEAYREAIDKDPSFAPAYAGLAIASAFASSRPIGAGSDKLASMRAAAARALSLDPQLPEANDAMGIVYARLGSWEEAQRSFGQAIKADPNWPAARLDYAMNVLAPIGWISNALQQVRIAVQYAPSSPDVQEAYAYLLISAGQFEQAKEPCQKAKNSRECQGRILIGEGRLGEAIQVLELNPNSRYLGYVYGRAGRKADAKKFAAISPGALQQVLIYAGLGDKDHAFQALDRMAELGPVRVGRTLGFPELAFLRSDPREKALRKKVGLPD
jgi:tetratricopeptide (TPR) repeat protein